MGNLCGRPPKRGGKELDESNNLHGNSRPLSDNFTSLRQVQEALRRQGLDSTKLLLAVDFTSSNESNGEHCFRGRSLHWLGNEPNPYEQVMSTMAKTLRAFDDDHLLRDGQSIAVLGFGDVTTQDIAVFNFFRNDAPARGLDSLLTRYRELVPHVRQASLTSFAPAIYQAMKLVIESGCQYHILVIIADGQVTRPPELASSQASAQEMATINAIVAASELPLSILLVGVGDEAWADVQQFTARLPERRWNNFHFVNFTEVSRRHQREQDPNGQKERLQAQFAINALGGIPAQVKLMRKLGILGQMFTISTNVRCLPPPAPPLATPLAVFRNTPSVAPLHITSGSDDNMSSMAHSEHTIPSPFTRWAEGEGELIGTQRQHISSTIARVSENSGAAPPDPFGKWASQLTPMNTHTSARLLEPASGSQEAPLSAESPDLGSGHNSQVQRPSMARLDSVPENQDSVVMIGDCLVHVDPLYICPISQKMKNPQIMMDPVMAGDGFTYDRAAITQWLQQNDTSPMTSTQLPHKMLNSNTALKVSIMEFLEAVNS